MCVCVSPGGPSQRPSSEAPPDLSPSPHVLAVFLAQEPMGGPASSAGNRFGLAVGGRVPVLRIRLAHRHFRQATGTIRDGAQGAGRLGALRVPLRDTRRGDGRLRFTACRGNNSAIEAPDLQSSSSGQRPERTRRAVGITQERSPCEVCGPCPGQGERPFPNGISALTQNAKGLPGSKSLRPEPATSNNALEAKRKPVPGVTKGQELTPQSLTGYIHLDTAGNA